MSARPVPSVGATREMSRRADSGTSEAEYEAQKAEQEMAMESFTNFKKFNLPIFSGESFNLMKVESWVDTMEELFENIRVSERNQVPLAIPFLDKMAHRVEGRVSEVSRCCLASTDWEKFWELLFATYFPDSARQQIEENFKNLKQGSCTV